MYSPKYTITNQILRNIGSIEAAKEVIDNAPLLPYYEKKFRDDAMVRAVHYGTHIEGNELSLTEAGKVLSGQVVVGRDRDIQEVLNYRKVMEMIGEQSFDSAQDKKTENRKQTIDEEMIFKLHRLTVTKVLPEEEQGKYRTKQVAIRNSRSAEVVFTPPSPDAVKGQMSDFIAFINRSSNEDIHPILKSGIVHY